MNYALKIVNEKFQSHNYFQWPTEGEAVCPDWKPTKTCGKGLHAFLNGEGDINACSISLDTANFLLLEIEDYIDLDGKIKFEKCKVLKHSKNINEIHELIREKTKRNDLESIKYSKKVEGKAFLIGGYKSNLTAGYRSTLTAGNESTLTAWNWSTLTAGNESTLTAGYNSTLTAGYKSTLTAGGDSILKAGYKSTLTAGDDSTFIVYGSMCYIMKNGKNCVLIQHANELHCLKLDDLLKDFKIGDKIKIENGKAICKIVNGFDHAKKTN